MKNCFLVLLGMAFYIMSCGDPLKADGGGGSEVEATGIVYLPNGDPAPAALVKLIPKSYNAFESDSSLKIYVDETNSGGVYKFKDVIPGAYNIQALESSEGNRSLVTGITVKKGSNSISDAMLKKPGSIHLVFSAEYQNSEGYIYLPGTDISKGLSEGQAEMLLDSVPAGVIPELRVNDERDSSVIVLKDLEVQSQDTTEIAYPGWSFSQKIRFNTSSTGADIASDLMGYPVLIRLSEANFNFSQFDEGGKDIRFVKPDFSVLPHEIERWDNSSRHADVWVLLDTLYGNNSQQFINMYWGNEEASDMESGLAVFDTSNGYQGVWHLAEIGNEDALDATPNNYHGSAFNMENSSFVSGIIGGSRSFNGESSYITMPNTQDSKLDFPEDGQFTLSAWVKIDSLDSLAHGIVSKGYHQYFLRFSYFPTIEPLWEFVNFTETSNWEVINHPAEAKKWVLLTGVRDGGKQYFYFNNILADSAVTLYPNGFLRDTSRDLTVGRFLEDINFPLPDGYSFFKGEIDEVRISSAPRSPDWIKLNYISQSNEEGFLIFE